jgi:UTP-glucose-1-phosphate uridylyltransferase
MNLSEIHENGVIEGAVDAAEVAVEDVVEAPEIESKPSAIEAEEYAALIGLQNKQLRLKASAYDVLRYKEQFEARVETERKQIADAEASLEEQLKAATEEYATTFSEIVKAHGFEDPSKVSISPEPPYALSLIEPAPAA